MTLPDRTAFGATVADLGDGIRGGTEPVGLGAVGGRRLARPVVAEGDRPTHDTATMDGFAVAADEGFPLSVRDRRVDPEDDPPTHDPGHATPVATGAPLPRGADAVLPREDARRDGDGESDGGDTAAVDRIEGPRLDPWTHVLRRGSYCEAGETLFVEGRRLSPRDAALLSDVGRDEVAVRERLSVGVLATGDEVDAGVQPDRDSATLAGLVRCWGDEATMLGTVPDDPAVVRTRLADAAAEHDVLLTTGGTSVGDRDHTVGALSDLGTVVQRGVALRPGRPTTCVRLDGGTVAFALPGKPVAAYVAAVAAVAPFFRGSRSLPWRTATVDRPLTLPDEPLEYAIPVAVEGETAVPVGSPDSAIDCYGERYRPGRVAACPRALAGDGLVFATDSVAAGERVEWTPFPTLEAP